MTTEITSPGALLQALDAAERSAKLPPPLAELCAHALREPRRWGVLVAAGRGLKVWQRILTEDGLPPSAAVDAALVQVRSAMRELRRRP